jgi:hypothetical protein
LKAFVKCEKIDASKKDPVPRIIQPRNARYNLSLAAFIKPHEHNFYKRVDRMFDVDGLGDKTIFKGLNATTAASNFLLKASRFSKPVFVGLDASRFDQHVSATALRWEHQIYLKSFAYGHSELAKLLDWQVGNIGRSYLKDGKIKYKVQGHRMSGDMNTSLGNCLLMSSMCHSYLRTHMQGGKFALANNGDDCCIIVEERDLAKLNELEPWFLEMGFNIVREKPVFDIRQVSFCQVNVLTSKSVNICVRNPNVVVSKDLHSAFPFTHNNEYLQWLSASGQCGLNSHRRVPVLESFYRAFPQDAITHAKIQEELDNWYRYSIVGGTEDGEIEDEMRHSFWLAFGITPDSQIALEEMFKRMKFGDAVGTVNHIPYVSLLQGNNLTNC